MRYNELLEYKKYSDDGRDFDYVDSPLHRGTNELLRNRPDTDRGPHQNKELNMMLAGVKPAALIDVDEYDLLWKPYVDQGKFIARKFTNIAGWDNYIVALPGEEQRIDRMIKMLTDTGPASDVYHVKLGRMLGYTKDQIRKFIG
jgi:hypothetical protein